MTELDIREPSPAHPISVVPTGSRVVVRVGGTVVADTTAALTLREADYPSVQYIPLADVVAGTLTASDTTSYCPYKGEARYHGIDTGHGTVADALWFYPQPYPAVGQIAGHVAFYPDKADVRVG